MRCQAWWKGVTDWKMPLYSKLWDSIYRNFPKYRDTQKICCNHSKIWTMWLYHRVMSPNGADGMANSVDPDQTARRSWSGSALFAQAYLSGYLGSLRNTQNNTKDEKWVLSKVLYENRNDVYCTQFLYLPLARRKKSNDVRKSPSDILSSDPFGAYAQLFSRTICLPLWLKFPLDLLLMWANSNGSGKTARMRRLAWTFAFRICNNGSFRTTRLLCVSFFIAKGCSVESPGQRDSNENPKKYKHGKNIHIWASSRGKPVFGVCDRGRLKPAWAATELEISDIETRGIILSRQWTTKVLIRLRGCAGWSASLLFAYGINRFSHDVAHIISTTH